MLELLNEPAWLLSLGGILGLLIGSFLNVVIYRLPVMMETACAEIAKRFWPKKTQQQKNRILSKNAST